MFETRKVKKTNKSKLYIFIVLVLGIIAVLGYSTHLKNEKIYQEDIIKVMPDLENTNIPITIEEGSSITAISNFLVSKELIPSSKSFIKYINRLPGSIKLLSGKFVIPKESTIKEIVEILSGQKQYLITIAIPEGFTAKQIDKVLTKNNLITGGEFSSCIYEKIGCDLKLKYVTKTPDNYEGYLFPATYYVNPADFSVELFAQRLVDNLEGRIPDSWIEELPKKNISFENMIIMASMVERETRKEEERPIVAGILWKRLNQGWPLGVDATSRYINENWSDTLSKHDFDKESLYNTRKHQGLPPGAIANPSLSSIKSSLYPEKTDYWFYLHGNDGQIHYAVTNEEHNINKAKYIN